MINYLLQNYARFKASIILSKTIHDATIENAVASNGLALLRAAATVTITATAIIAIAKITAIFKTFAP
jgi:hypothetical protein